MQRFRLAPAIIAGILFLLLAGCAGSGRTVSVRDGGRPETVRMTAADFKFDPAVIKASPGGVLTIEIENTSNADHNFTIKDPSGKVLQDIELPEKTTQEVRIEISQPGIYPYHCDKPFHATLGMKGRIEVE
ncbi:MAG: cupredoxin domain-containing protein [Deltaproteobacteria bacterium]|jgi:plastocyanin